MTELVKVACITSGTTLLGLFLSRLWSRSEHKATAEHIKTVYLSVNSRMDELLKARGLEEHAAGVAEGRQAGINEKHDRVVEEERKEDRAEDKARKT